MVKQILFQQYQRSRTQQPVSVLDILRRKFSLTTTCSTTESPNAIVFSGLLAPDAPSALHRQKASRQARKDKRRSRSGKEDLAARKKKSSRETTVCFTGGGQGGRGRAGRAEKKTVYVSPVLGL